MRTRRFVLTLGALTLLAVAGWVTISVLFARPYITAEQGGQIRAGMTRAEVQAILGVPPGDYTGFDNPGAVQFLLQEYGLAGAPYETWAAEIKPAGPHSQPGTLRHDAIFVAVMFDKGGRVNAVHRSRFHYLSLTVPERISQW